MNGAHAAPARPLLAAELAVMRTLACPGRVAARIPRRAWLWGVLLGALPAAVDIDARNWLQPHDVYAGYSAVSIACALLLVFSYAAGERRRAARQARWRETAGRMDGHYHGGRVDENAERIAVLEERFGALMAAMEAAYQTAGEDAPADGPHERHLRLVKGDTNPLPSAG